MVTRSGRSAQLSGVSANSLRVALLRAAKDQWPDLLAADSSGGARES